MPVVRAAGGVQGASVRLGAVSLVVLIAGLVLAQPPLVPAAIVLACGGYAAELAIDDAPLDSYAAVVAAGVFLAAELAYWSIEEREGVPADPGAPARRAAFVALLGLGALLVGAVLLELAGAIHSRSLALDVVGTIAAAAALLVVARNRAAGR